MGIGQQREAVIGVLTTRVWIRDTQLPIEVDFAVIAGASLPCCCLLGAGTMQANHIVLDYRQGAVFMGKNNRESKESQICEDMISSSHVRAEQ